MINIPAKIQNKVISNINNIKPDQIQNKPIVPPSKVDSIEKLNLFNQDLKPKDPKKMNYIADSLGKFVNMKIVKDNSPKNNTNPPNKDNIEFSISPLIKRKSNINQNHMMNENDR